MPSYKILVENSTLGAIGATVTDEEIANAPADVELLIASGIVAPLTKPHKEKE